MWSDIAVHKFFSFSYSAIVLASLKLTTEEIYESVLSANTDLLSVQTLRSLESLAPTADEVRDDVFCTTYFAYRILTVVTHFLCFFSMLKCSELKQFYNDPTVLGKADQFACKVS